MFYLTYIDPTLQCYIINSFKIKKKNIQNTFFGITYEKKYHN